MKKLWDKLVEMFFGILPILIIFGLPSLIALIVWLACNWDDIPKILNILSQIGKGSYLLGIFSILFGAIFIFNTFTGFVLTLEKIEEKLNAKWFYTYIITTFLGFIAIMILINNIF